jgi:CRP/FNR family transcriptional regulator
MIKSTGEIRARCPWAHLLAESALSTERMEFSEDSVVYESRTPARRLYFIDSGQVRTYEAGENESARLLQILGPGEWFGDDAFAAESAHSSRAVAVSATVLSAVPVEKLMALLARDPSIAVEVIRQLASRLQVAREDGSRFVFDDCGARLVKTLLRFSVTAAATPQDDGAVTLRITHRQLAEAVGAARETVSLALTQLRQQNLLRTGRNRLVFQPEMLREFANGNGTAAHMKALAR